MEAQPVGGARIVADLMLRNPKTLGVDTRVEDVRRMLENPSVQMVLLIDGQRFAGSITEIPEAADPDAPALDYTETDPQTISPDADAETAFARTAAAPSRRLIVLDHDRTLVGLLCLNQAHTGFCGAGIDGTTADDS
jgi:CBS domain-containing protein